MSKYKFQLFEATKGQYEPNEELLILECNDLDYTMDMKDSYEEQNTQQDTWFKVEAVRV